MLAMAIGTFKFGAAMMPPVVLTNAAAQGATTLALQPRHDHRPTLTTTTAINNAAPALTTASDHQDGDDQRHGLRDQHGVHGA